MDRQTQTLTHICACFHTYTHTRIHMLVCIDICTHAEGKRHKHALLESRTTHSIVWLTVLGQLRYINNDTFAVLQTCIKPFNRQIQRRGKVFHCFNIHLMLVWVNLFLQGLMMAGTIYVSCVMAHRQYFPEWLNYYACAFVATCPNLESVYYTEFQQLLILANSLLSR